MTPRPSVLFVHVGSPRHGVSRFGQVLAASTPETVVCEQMRVDPLDPRAAEVVARRRAGCSAALVAFQFTDQLYASDPATAADRLEALVAAAGPATTSVVLHDLPGCDGPRSGSAERPDPRRAAYGRVAVAVDVAVVSSHHEAARLAALTSAAAVAAVAPVVVAHFVERRPRMAPRPSPTVGVLGYLYPGKGHAEVIDAATTLRPPIDVVALGGPAPLHAELARQLHLAARCRGVRFQVTGWVPDTEVDLRLAAIGVPVVPNHEVSASGSLATWLGSGRRPLVRTGAYAREVADGAPGTITLYDPGEPCALSAAIDRVRQDPGSSWHDEVLGHLDPRVICRRHLRAGGIAA